MKPDVQKMGNALKNAAQTAAGGIKTFSEAVAGKSKDLVELSKLNMQKNQKQKETDDFYKKLGELAYSKGRLRGEMAEIAQKIKQNYADLQKIEIDINALQSSDDDANEPEADEIKEQMIQAVDVPQEPKDKD